MGTTWRPSARQTSLASNTSEFCKSRPSLHYYSPQWGLTTLNITVTRSWNWFKEQNREQKWSLVVRNRTIILKAWEPVNDFLLGWDNVFVPHETQAKCQCKAVPLSLRNISFQCLPAGTFSMLKDTVITYHMGFINFNRVRCVVWKYSDPLTLLHYSLILK
jgi:hypothetical protein